MTNRAVFSFQHMINCVDFDRMSPSYELRLSKYMARGFSTYVPNYSSTQLNISKYDQYWQNKKEYSMKFVELRTLKFHLEGIEKYNNISLPPDEREELQTKLNNFIVPEKPKALQGLEILIHHGFHMINRTHANRKSDYSDVSDTYFIKWDSTTDISLLTNREDKVIMYKINDKINIDQIFNVTQIDTTNFKVSPKIVWKKINPGEQTTSTFHQIVLNNLNSWYECRFL